MRGQADQFGRRGSSRSGLRAAIAMWLLALVTVCCGEDAGSGPENFVDAADLDETAPDLHAEDTAQGETDAGADAPELAPDATAELLFDDADTADVGDASETVVWPGAELTPAAAPCTPGGPALWERPIPPATKLILQVHKDGVRIANKIPKDPYKPIVDKPWRIAIDWSGKVSEGGQVGDCLLSDGSAVWMPEVLDGQTATVFGVQPDGTLMVVSEWSYDYTNSFDWNLGACHVDDADNWLIEAVTSGQAGATFEGESTRPQIVLGTGLQWVTSKDQEVAGVVPRSFGGGGWHFIRPAWWTTDEFGYDLTYHPAHLGAIDLGAGWLWEAGAVSVASISASGDVAKTDMDFVSQQILSLAADSTRVYAVTVEAAGVTLRVLNQAGKLITGHALAKAVLPGPSKPSKFQLLPALSGTYLLEIRGYGQPGGVNRSLLSRLGPAGELLWQKEWSLKDGMWIKELHAAPGGLLLVGERQLDDGSLQQFVARTDAWANWTCADSGGCAAYETDDCDGNACSTGDLCAAGACLSGQVTACDDSNSCTTDACVAGTCQFALQEGALCGPVGMCAAMRCDALGGCVLSYECPCTKSEDCADGSAATVEQCVNGHCAIQNVSCDDGDPCTQWDWGNFGVCEGKVYPWTESVDLAVASTLVAYEGSLRIVAGSEANALCQEGTWVTDTSSYKPYEPWCASCSMTWQTDEDLVVDAILPGWGTTFKQHIVLTGERTTSEGTQACVARSDGEWKLLGPKDGISSFRARDRTGFDGYSPPSSGWFAGTTTGGSAGGRDGWLVREQASYLGPAPYDLRFGGPADDEFWDGWVLEGGAAIAVGSTASSGAGMSDGWLVAVDAAGNLTETQTWGGPGEDSFRALLPLPDGRLALLGTWDALGAPQFWLVLREADGTTSFDKPLGPGTFWHAIWQEPGQILLAGDAGPTASGVRVMAVSLTGQLLWSQVLGQAAVAGPVRALTPVGYDGQVWVGGLLTKTGPGGAWEQVRWRVDALGATSCGGPVP